MTLLAGCRTLLGIDEGIVATDGGSQTDGMPDAPFDAMIDASPDAMLQSWWNASYPWRHSITFDTTGLSVPIQSVPLLVRLPGTAINLANGSDLRFVDWTNTRELPFEIETISSTGAVIWVLMDLDASTKFYVYGGTLTPTAASSGAAVFGAYESVHHLQTFADASGHSHLAESVGPGTGAIDTNGIVNQARDFDGTSDAYRLANSDTPFDFTSSLSASAWIKVQDFTTMYQPVVTKGDTSWRMQRENQTNMMAFGSNAGGLVNNAVGTTVVSNDQWHHVAISFSANVKSLYVDGVLDATSIVATIDTNSQEVRIGGNSQFSRFWKGKIDEVRISAAPRTSAQFKADLETVITPARLTVGTREPMP